MTLSLLVGVAFAALLLLAQTNAALAATAPSLGTAATFAILGGSTVTNTGSSVLTGDLGVSPGLAITGFPPGIVNGTTHAGGAVALQAQSDLVTAYNDLAGQACDTDLTGQDLGGMTLTPGAYCFSSSAQLTGTLTLDAQGDVNAVFVFQIGSTLTTASSSVVQIINGGSNCNVFWQVGTSATLGTGTLFEGSILALTSITLDTSASVIGGQLLARNGAVTLDTNSVSVCLAPPLPGSITINKTAVGGDDTFGYTGSAALGAPFNIITSGGAGSHGTTGLSVGAYTVTESTMPAGWVRTGLVCTDSTAGSTFTYSGAQANIALAAGGTVTCTYTNNLSPPAVSVPTLSEWGMIIFIVLMGLGSIYYLRRRRIDI